MQEQHNSLVLRKGEALPYRQMADGRRLREVFLLFKLGSPHGIHGAMKYQKLGKSDEPKKKKKYLLIDKEEKFLQECEVTFSGEGKTAVCKLSHLKQREEAEKLIHCYLALERSKMPTLAPNEYYNSDLLACSVFDRQRGYIGKIKEISQATGQDVYTVDRTELGKKDLLFVAQGGSIEHIDVEAGRIDLNLPVGLWEIYEA